MKFPIFPSPKNTCAVRNQYQDHSNTKKQELDPEQQARIYFFTGVLLQVTHHCTHGAENDPEYHRGYMQGPDFFKGKILFKKSGYQVLQSAGNTPYHTAGK